MIRTALFAALALTTVTAAHAAPVDSLAPQQHVKFGDLNLAIAQGRDTFEHRIQLAANAVCKPISEVPGSMLRNERLFRSCRETALAGVHPQALAAIQRASGLAGIDQPVVVASR